MVDLRGWGPRRGSRGAVGQTNYGGGAAGWQGGETLHPPRAAPSSRTSGRRASRASPQSHRPALGRHNRRARSLLMLVCHLRLVEDRSPSAKPLWGSSPEASIRHPIEGAAGEGERKGQSASWMSVRWLSAASEPAQLPRWEEERQRASWRQNRPDRFELRSPSGSTAPQQPPRRATGWPAGMIPRMVLLAGWAASRIRIVSGAQRRA